MKGVIQIQKYCMKCMGLISSTLDTCPICGHDNRKPNPLQALQIGEVLLERYLTGCVTKTTNEGFTYIAYDGKNERIINIVEFFPNAICQRSQDMNTVEVVDGKSGIFDMLYQQFNSLNERLATLGSASSVLRCYKVIPCNNTLYAIIQVVQGKSLDEYLRENFGEISWQKAEEMFTPLIYGLNTINSFGISHKGISPENIIVENDKILKLTGFSIDYNRVKNDIMRPQLYDGYSAIEQYYQGAKYGEYTDVYSFCAVLYRALTGITPLSVSKREHGETIIHPCDVNRVIPIEVGDALVKGLLLDYRVRTQTFKELMKELYSAPMHAVSYEPPPTKVFETNPVQRTVATPTDPNEGKSRGTSSIEESNETMAFIIEKTPSTPLPKITPPKQPPQGISKAKKKLPMWVIVLLISLPIMLGVFSLLYSLVLGGNNKNKHESTTSVESTTSEESSSSEEQSKESSKESSSEVKSSLSESSSEDLSNKVTVENFVGLVFNDFVNLDKYKNDYVFYPTYEYDEFVEKGAVISQGVKPETVVIKGVQIDIVISKGERYFTVPPIVDSAGVFVNAKEYASILEEHDIPYELVNEETEEIAEGEIVKLNFQTGAKVDRQAKDIILIYVATPITSVDINDILDE